MKKARFERALKRACLIFAALLAPFWLAGCASLHGGANTPQLTAAVQDYGPGYKPANVYRLASSLPARIRRVAVLPLTTSSGSSLLQDGTETLEPVLYAELEKCRRFEVVQVTGEQMHRLTGQSGWRTDEALPADFFTRVREATGCDAVLFSQLTRYQPYQPLATGWKFRLVETPNDDSLAEGFPGRTLWSADELLDSGDPAVANSAREYYMQHLRNAGPAPDATTILSSPTRFGQYTLSTLLNTLPERTPGKK